MQRIGCIFATYFCMWTNAMAAVGGTYIAFDKKVASGIISLLWSTTQVCLGVRSCRHISSWFNGALTLDTVVNCVTIVGAEVPPVGKVFRVLTFSGLACSALGYGVKYAGSKLWK